MKTFLMKSLVKSRTLYRDANLFILKINSLLFQQRGSYKSIIYKFLLNLFKEDNIIYIYYIIYLCIYIYINNKHIIKNCTTITMTIEKPNTLMEKKRRSE